MSKTIGIVGTRSRDDKASAGVVWGAFLKIADEEDRLVSGGCPQGADRFAELIAEKQGMTITIHYPDWKKYGKSAGFIRNSQIANDADVLIACVSKNRKGGTEDTIKKFLKRKSEKDLVIV